MSYIHTPEEYSAIKRNELPIHHMEELRKHDAEGEKPERMATYCVIPFRPRISKPRDEKPEWGKKGEGECGE